MFLYKLLSKFNFTSQDNTMDYKLIRWNSLFQLSSPYLFRTVEGHPISFFFHVDNSKMKNNFERLVIKNGGSIIEEYINRTPFTALMMDDNCSLKVYNRVPFKASYIIKCVKSRCLININAYIHTNAVPPSCIHRYMKHDYRKIIFFKICPFSEENFNRESEHNVKLSSEQKLTDNQDRPSVIVDISEENETINAGTSRDTDVREIEHSFQTKHCPTCKCFSVKISDNEQPPVSGPIRNSSKSFKSRPDNSRSNFQEIASKRMASISSSIDSDDSNIKHNESISSEDDVIEVRIPASHEIPPAHSSGNHDTTCIVLSEDDDDIGPPPADGPPGHFARSRIDKHTRQLYSTKEKEAILKYLIRENALHVVKGRNIWERMELDNICPQRTWVSLSNHFKRVLVDELEKFPFLTLSQIKLLRK